MAEWWQGICDQFVKCFIREDRYMLLLDGIGVTIKVTILALIIGLILGFLIALCNLSKNKLLKNIYRCNQRYTLGYSAHDYILCCICKYTLGEVGDCSNCLRYKQRCLCIRDNKSRYSVN